MVTVTFRPSSRTDRAPDDAPPGASRAWLLDVVAFHEEFARLHGSDDVTALRTAAAAVWDTQDVVGVRYISTLPTPMPEEWSDSPDRPHLGEWYRLLMAPHLTPVGALSSPQALKDRLPSLGWPHPDARRLARGRELATLASVFAPEHLAGDLELALPFGNKGWLSPDDAAAFLDRFRTMPRRAFRGNAHLVPLVEEAFDVLGTLVDAAGRDDGPGPVLLLSGG